jgi:hypothetical protein
MRATGCAIFEESVSDQLLADLREWTRLRPS